MSDKDVYSRLAIKIHIEGVNEATDTKQIFNLKIGFGFNIMPL